MCSRCLRSNLSYLHGLKIQVLIEATSRIPEQIGTPSSYKIRYFSLDCISIVNCTQMHYLEMEFYLKYQPGNNHTMFSSNVWETIMHIDRITETVLKEMDQTHRQSEWWESQAKSPVWSTSSIVSSAPCKGNSFTDGIIPSLPHAATISKQKLPKAVLWRAKDFPLWRMLLSLTAKCTLWQRRGMIFPGVQTILSSHPHSHEFFRSGFGTVGFSVSHSMKQCIMNTVHAPPQTNTGCLSDLFISGIHASKGKTPQTAHFSSSLGFYNHILLVFPH